MTAAPVELLLGFGLPLFATLVFLLSRIFGGPRFGAEPSAHHDILAPIHRAALAGDWPGVLKALEGGATIDDGVPPGLDEEGATALHLAAGAGHAELVSLLLHRGAAVNARDVRGRLALHHAAEQGQSACVGTLLAGGSPANAVDDQGQTALALAEAADAADVVTLLRSR